MINQLVTQFFWMCVDVSGKPLADEHPHHVGRDADGTVVSVGLQHTLEEDVLIHGDERVTHETASHNLPLLLGNSFVFQNVCGHLVSAI